ncbi:MAG: NUDIX hydrolase [Candidatus Aminicenantes bacterium]
MSFKNCPVCGALLNSRTIEERERLFCPGCGWVHYENPLPSAAAFVKNAEDGILLVKRGIDPGYGKWALPSGFIEIEETPEMACLRELQEETGLEGQILRLIGVYSQESFMYKNVIIIGYEVEARGEIHPGSDSLSAEYFSPQRLPEIAFPSHIRMIADGTKMVKE